MLRSFRPGADGRPLPEHPSRKIILSRKIAHGTRNYLEENAMSAEELSAAIEAGKQVAADLYAQGCNCIGLGEMGIGNTSSASLIMSYVTGIPVEDCAGRGTGVNDQQLEQKEGGVTQMLSGDIFRPWQPIRARSPSCST